MMTSQTALPIRWIFDPYEEQQGEISIQSLNNGVELKHALLQTHANQLCEEPDCFQPDLRMIFVLEGQAHLQFDGCDIELKAGTDRAGVFLPINEPTMGRKIYYRGNQNELVLFCRSMYLEKLGCPSSLAGMIRRSHLQARYFALTPAIHKQILRLQQTYFLPASWRGLHQQAQSIALIAEVFQELFPEGSTVESTDSAQLKRVEKLIELLRDPESEQLTLDELARLCHSNSTTLQANFQAAYGVSIARYRREYRLYLARDALKQHASVAQASQLAGYNNPDCFSKAFKKCFGKSPSKY